jgi:hypothetical protein
MAMGAVSVHSSPRALREALRAGSTALLPRSRPRKGGTPALGAPFVESHAIGLLLRSQRDFDGCIDHTQGIVDDELHDSWTQLMDQSGATLFGRNTYQLISR